MSSEVAARRRVANHRSALLRRTFALHRRAGRRARTVWVAGLATCLVAALPAGALSSQIATGGGNPCKLDPPFWTPLHLLPQVPPGVRAVTVDGWFELVPPPPPPAPRRDSFFLRDDRGLGGRIALLPIPDFDRDFRDVARTLMGRHLEVSGCLEGDEGPGGSRGILRFYGYAVIPEPKRDRPPREVELASLRDGAFEGQRVLVRGVLAGRRHTALRLSTRLADSDWVLASDDAAAWMRGQPPEGEGFRLDPDDASDHGRGLAVVGLVAWWRGAPVIHVESVRMTRAGRRGAVAILFALPLDGRLDAEEPTIEVRFSAAMDESSFDGRVDLVDAAGRPVPARRAYDAELWSLLVSPQVAPAPGAELELRLRDGIVSAEGDAVRPDPEAPERLLLVRRYRVSGT